MIRPSISLVLSFALGVSQAPGQWIRIPRSVDDAAQTVNAASRRAQAEQATETRNKNNEILRQHNAMMIGLRQRANSGDVDAQYQLGMEYENPTPLPARNNSQSLTKAQPDYINANVWYTKAAKGGSLPAAYQLGTLYMTGTGMPHDADKAYYLLKWASYNRYAPAQTYFSTHFTLADIKHYDDAEKQALARQQAWIEAQKNAQAAQRQQVADDNNFFKGLFLAGAAAFGAIVVLGAASSHGSSSNSTSSSSPMEPETGLLSQKCKNDRNSLLMGQLLDSEHHDVMGIETPRSCF